MSQQTARTPFRTTVNAVIAFYLAGGAALWFVPSSMRLMFAGIILFVGLVILTAGKAGYFPPRK